MKIQSIKLKNFKRFRDKEFDFTDSETGLAKDLIVLIGINGTGKTTILQAIAATLGVATGRLKKLSELKWAGFNYEVLGSNGGRFKPSATIEVQFSAQEIQSIHEFQQKLQKTKRNLLSPVNEEVVTLTWHGEHVQAKTSAELFQFRGREYARQLLSSENFQIFEKVGTAFWYTEQRTSTSLTSEDYNGQLEITDNILRDRLSKWRQFHLDIESGHRIKELRPGQKDLYAEIERTYQTVFPERNFEGTIPREGVDDILSEPWFYLYDEESKNHYEISEMSAGERAIFPMFVDFASWNIHNSVILIDEIELHLHPPLQQALLRALPKLGKNNQFIITTHSDYVEQLVSESHIIRLEV